MREAFTLILLLSTFLAACDLRGKPEPRDNLVPPGETVGQIDGLQHAAKILNACDGDPTPDGGPMKITVMAAHLENGAPRFAVNIETTSDPDTATCIMKALAP